MVKQPSGKSSGGQAPAHSALPASLFIDTILLAFLRSVARTRCALQASVSCTGGNGRGGGSLLGPPTPTTLKIAEARARMRPEGRGYYQICDFIPPAPRHRSTGPGGKHQVELGTPKAASLPPRPRPPTPGRSPLHSQKGTTPQPQSGLYRPLAAPSRRPHASLAP